MKCIWFLSVRARDHERECCCVRWIRFNFYYICIWYVIAFVKRVMTKPLRMDCPSTSLWYTTSMIFSVYQKRSHENRSNAYPLSIRISFVFIMIVQQSTTCWISSGKWRYVSNIPISRAVWSCASKSGIAVTFWTSLSVWCTIKGRCLQFIWLGHPQTGIEKEINKRRDIYHKTVRCWRVIDAGRVRYAGWYRREFGDGYSKRLTTIINNQFEQ